MFLKLKNNITATCKQAQVLVEYARKGNPLLVEGNPSTRGLTAKIIRAFRLTFSRRTFVSSERATRFINRLFFRCEFL